MVVANFLFMSSLELSVDSYSYLEGVGETKSRQSNIPAHNVTSLEETAHSLMVIVEGISVQRRA